MKGFFRVSIDAPRPLPYDDLMKTHTVGEKGFLLEYLFGHFPQMKKLKLKQLLKHASVTVNGTVVTSHKHPLSPGDKIDFLTQKEAGQNRLRVRLGFDILYEDEWLIVIDKPAGLLTMGTEKDKIHTAYYQLTEYIRAQSEDGRGRIFIVHRLDREASGIVVFAKKEVIKEKLQKEWSSAVKKYYAIVEGIPKKSSDTIESYLVEDKFRRVYSASGRSRDAKHAATFYRVLENKKGYTLLDVTLITGRKNQIRVHLSDIGHPIAGDDKYGSASGFGRLALHAYYLSFKHPATEEVKTFKTDLPGDF